MKNKLYLLSGVGVLLFALLTLSCYIQPMDQQSLVLRFGKIARVVKEPGILFKAPSPVESLTRYTKRYIMYDSPEVDVITRDKKTVVFDTVAFFLITDPEEFYVRFGSVNNAQKWIDDTVYSSIRNQVGRITFDEVIYEKREAAIAYALQYVNENGKNMGIKVDSLFFKRTSIPRTNEESVYISMVAEREQQAAQIRAEGGAKAKEIQSNADKVYITRVSEAQKIAEEIKGEADAKAQAMIGQTMEIAPDLYAYLKKLAFFRQIVPGTPMIVKLDGILKDIKGGF